jgi:hypothetical protein
MSCVMESALGAYALHALEPEDTELLRCHLFTCDSCQDELAGLAWVTSILSRLTVEDVDDPLLLNPAGHDQPVPPQVLDRVLASVREEKPRRRPRGTTWAAIAFAVVSAAAAAAAIVVTAQHGASDALHLRATSAATHITGDFTITDRSWGTQIQVSLVGTYPPGQCVLVAHSRGGRTETAATWTAGRNGTTAVPAASSFPVSQLSELDVVSAAGRRLVGVAVPRISQPASVQITRKASPNDQTGAQKPHHQPDHRHRGRHAHASRLW